MVCISKDIQVQFSSIQFSVIQPVKRGLDESEMKKSVSPPLARD